MTSVMRGGLKLLPTMMSSWQILKQTINIFINTSNLNVLNDDVKKITVHLRHTWLKTFTKTILGASVRIFRLENFV